MSDYANACAGMKHDIFYSDTAFEVDLAKSICRGCPVRARCLQLAIDNGEEGIWGGFDETERRLYMRLYGPVVADEVQPLDLRALRIRAS